MPEPLQIPYPRDLGRSLRFRVKRRKQEPGGNNENRQDRWKVMGSGYFLTNALL